jgi:hypothetical protein
MNQVPLFALPEATTSPRAERTYGTVSFDRKGGVWLVDCEPHVRGRLKRVVPKLHHKAHLIELADAIDVARDLAWFLERYPMEMAAADRRRMLEMERSHKTMVADLGRILTAGYTPVGARLAVDLREYQAVAVDLTRRVSGLLLADDVGVGKTAVGIGVIADPASRPALVVTLTHLPKQWQREIDRFLPGLRVHILKKGQPYPIEPFPDVIVSNYHKLVGWSAELSGRVRSVVFDEAHELRRTGSQKYQAAAEVCGSAQFRLGLTATPIFNYGGEAFNVIDVLRPGALGTWDEFATEWCKGWTDRTKATIADPKAFGSYARENGLMLRRTRRDVGRELPALTICPHVVDADLEELTRIESEATKLALLILGQGGDPFAKMRASEELSWKLRLATGLAKAPFVAEFVKMLLENGEAVLLYGWHHEVYRIWADRLKSFKPAFFTGKESPTAKDKSVAGFLGGETNLLVMSLRSGAGIDGLQKRCRTVVFGEPDWSPAVHEQATGRVYRDGQSDPVVAYYLLANCGSDPVIADVLGVKSGQLDGIRDPESALVSKSQTDPERVKKLAEEYLRTKGAGDGR